jgi:hypothetical protein
LYFFLNKTSNYYKSINKIYFFKDDIIFSNFQSTFINLQLNRVELQSIIRNNQEYRNIYNMFIELEKPVHQFRPLIGVDNLKMISNFYESLLNAKKTLENQLIDKTERESSFFSTIYNSLFSSETETQLSSLSVENLNNLIKHLDDCQNLIQSFYKVKFNN